MSIAANPNIHSDGLGHLVNDALDGAKCIKAGLEQDYVRYSLKKNNIDIVVFYTESNLIKMWLVAKRDLKAGEELFYHYGLGYWRPQIKPTIALPDIVRINELKMHPMLVAYLNSFWIVRSVLNAVYKQINKKYLNALYGKIIQNTDLNEMD